jgi:hypothetical protein
MLKVVPDRDLFLILGVFRLGTRIALGQIATELVPTEPTLQCILGRVPQLANGCSNALAELDVQLDRPNPVLIRVHELPPGSPSFCPHLRRVSIG